LKLLEKLEIRVLKKLALPFFSSICPTAPVYVGYVTGFPGSDLEPKLSKPEVPTPHAAPTVFLHIFAAIRRERRDEDWPPENLLIKW
jgi:hypothetical protein